MKKGTSLGSLLIVMTSILMIPSSYSAPLSVSKAQYKKMYDVCLEMMKTKTCTVMNLAPILSNDIKQIYVPDFGPLDVNVYRELVKADTGMCKVIKKSCDKSRSSQMCKLGFALFKDMKKEDAHHSHH